MLPSSLSLDPQLNSRSRNVERYQAWFDAADLSAAQKEEFTQSLWNEAFRYD